MPHGAVALHVAVAADRAETGARAAQVAAQELQVDDFLDDRHRMMVLGDAHRPADDDPVRPPVHPSSLFDFRQAQPGLALQVFPGGGIQFGQVGLEAVDVLGDEGVVEYRLAALGLSVALPGEEELGDPADRRHVAAQCRTEERGVQRRGAVGQHFQRILRMLEALQAALLERVEADHLGAALHCFAQRLEHARVVGAGVLPKDEDRVGVFEVVEGHAALADPDAAAQCHAAGLVAHVRAVGEVVGAERADEQLVEVGRLVAGPPGGIELRLVGAIQASQVLGDQGEGGVPGDRLVVVAERVVAHRSGEAALVFQPVVALFAQGADAVTGEERRVDAALGGFPVDCLGAVLAELHPAVFRRVAPGAAGAVETAVLVGLEQGAEVLERLFAVQPEVRHAAQRAPAGGGTGVGLVAGLERLQAHDGLTRLRPAPGCRPAGHCDGAGGSGSAGGGAPIARSGRLARRG